MDLYCPKCGEPWGMNELHNVEEMTFQQAYRAFRRDGCAVFETRHNDPPNTKRAHVSRVLMEVLGDDVDGAASMMDDFLS